MLGLALSALGCSDDGSSGSGGGNNCCVLRTLCASCACESDVEELAHAGSEASCQEYLSGGTYGCPAMAEDEALAECEAGYGTEPDAERLRCAASEVSLTCECVLGGEPYFVLDIPMSTCNTSVFTPATVCCIEPSGAADTCECQSAMCSDDGTSCECSTAIDWDGQTQCEIGKYPNCCIRGTNGACVCSEEACGSLDTPVANCGVSDATCGYGVTSVMECSEESILAARLSG